MVEAKRVVWATAGRRPHDGGSWSSASWVGLMCRALAFAYDAARRTKRGGEAREFFPHTDRHCYTGASSPHTVHLCLGVMGPSIEVLCVASQVVCTFKFSA